MKTNKKNNHKKDNFKNGYEMLPACKQTEVRDEIMAACGWQSVMTFHNKRKGERIIREPEKTILFLDSVNAMLIYISSASITRFLHFLSDKLRVMNLGGIVLAVEKGPDPELMSFLTTFADGVLEDENGEDSEQKESNPGK